MELKSYQKRKDEIKEKEAKEIVYKFINEHIKKSYKTEVFNIFTNPGHEREESHSNFLAWLFDVRKKNKKSIQYHFLKRFLLEFCGINDNNIETIMKNSIEDIEVVREEEKIDILVKSKDFVLVIENKLDAKNNIDRNGISQLVRYREYATKEYGAYNPQFRLICPRAIEKEEEKESKELLKKTGFKVIEYSDIVMMLYEIINDEGIEKDNFKKEIVRQYIEYWEIYSGNLTGGGYTPIINGIFVWDACKILGIKYSDLKKE